MLDKGTKRNLGLFFLVFFGYLCGLALNIFLARHLSPADYGDLNIIMGILGIGGPIILLGANDAVVRFLPPLKQQGDAVGISAFLHWLFRILGMAVVAVLLFSALCLAFIFMTKHPSIIGHHYDVVLASILIPSLMFLVVFNNLLSYYEKFYAAATLMPIFRPIIYITLLVVAFYVYNSTSFYTIFLMLALSLMLVIFLQSYLLYKKIHNDFFKVEREKSKEVENKSKSHWLKASAGYMLGGIVGSALASIDLILLEVLGHSEEAVGYFSALIVPVGVLFLVPKAIYIVLQTKISAYYESKNIEKIQEMVNSSLKFGFLVGLIMLTAGYFFRFQFMSHFGESYIHLGNLMFIVAVAAFFMSLSVIPANLLQYTDKYKNVVYLDVISLIIAIGIDFALIPSYGIYGAVTSLIVVNLLANIAQCFLAKKYIGIKPFIIF